MPKPKSSTPIPSQAIQDQRLTPLDLRVLLGLCYYADLKTHVADASRKDIATLIGVHETSVSDATRRLHSFGWVIKVGAGRGTKYHINWVNSINEPSSFHEGSDTGNPRHFTRVQGEPTPETLVTSRGLEVGEQAEPSSNHEGLDPKQAKPSSFHEGLNRDNPRRAATVTTVGENRESTISSNINNLDSNYDPIRLSDQIRYGDAINVLTTHGMPPHFLQGKNFEKYRDVIKTWCNQEGITLGMLITACERAKKRKDQEGEPIGPGYVNSCLKSIIEETANAKSERINEQSYTADGWSG